MMTQVAHLKTPKKLVVIDLIDERLELAREYGADVTINPARDDAREIVRSLTDGYGCDVYIETTGAPVGVSQPDLIRKLGRFVEFSVFGEDATVDWSIIGDRKELDVRGAHLGPYCYPIAIDLLARSSRRKASSRTISRSRTGTTRSASRNRPNRSRCC